MGSFKLGAAAAASFWEWASGSPSSSLHWILRQKKNNREADPHGSEWEPGIKTEEANCILGSPQPLPSWHRSRGELGVKATPPVWAAWMEPRGPAL